MKTPRTIQWHTTFRGWRTIFKGGIFREKTTGRIFTVESASENAVLMMHDGLLFSTKREGFEQTLEELAAGCLR